MWAGLHIVRFAPAQPTKHQKICKTSKTPPPPPSPSSLSSMWNSTARATSSSRAVAPSSSARPTLGRRWASPSLGSPRRAGLPATTPRRRPCSPRRPRPSPPSQNGITRSKPASDKADGIKAHGPLRRAFFVFKPNAHKPIINAIGGRWLTGGKAHGKQRPRVALRSPLRPSDGRACIKVRVAQSNGLSGASTQALANIEQQGCG